MRSIVLFASLLLAVPSFSQSTVTLLSSDPKVKNLWLNVWLNEHQVDAQLCRFGTDYKIQRQEIPAREAIRISVGSPIRLVNNAPSSDWYFRYQFEPGDTVDITIGKSDMPVFSIRNKPGSHYETNLDYFYKVATNAKGDTVIARTLAAHHQKRDTYYQFIDSLYTARLLSDSFHTTVMNNRLFADQTALMGFYRVQKMPMTAQDFTAIPLFEDSLLIYSGYIPYMSSYIQAFLLPPSPKGAAGQSIHEVRFFNTCLKAGRGNTREQLLFKSLLRVYEFARPSFDSCFKKYSQVSLNKDNEQFLLSFKANADRDKQFASSTKTLKDQLINESSNAPVSFQALLNRHKGKVIYIDFWASWCAPCIAEMSPARELKEKLSGEPFVIISISLDESVSAWKAAAAKYLQDNKESYILTNAKRSTLVSQFKLTSIPRYLLVDKTGRIVDKDAKRPSDEQLISEIKKLL